jgi:hypothetical protein
MSLDVYLHLKGAFVARRGSGIFVRDDGQTKEITREQWDERNPGVEPVIAASATKTSQVYSANITHNLGRMAREAGVYDCCWRPDEHGLTQAKQLIEPLRAGIALMESEPERFKQYNPENGWGSYEGLVSWCKEYLIACEQYPEAEVSTWR